MIGCTRFWRAMAGLFLLVAVFAAVGWKLLRPVFWSSGGPAAPRHFQQTGAAAAFTDITHASGFRHTHHKPYLDSRLEPIMSWVSSVGAAVAAGDYDNDGWVDLYVTDSDRGRMNHLYRNLGDGTFADVAASAGVADVNHDGASMDCVWGDYDNDGFLDLYVVKWGRDSLFHNNGNGTFTDVTRQALKDERGQPGAPWANGCSAVWFDYDRDGWLDLYVGNYFAPLDLWNLPHTRIMHDDFEHARNAGKNFLYHNNRDGTFSEVGAELGVDDPGWTLSVGHGDINNDGWPDIYCANDFGTDKIFLNRGDGTFRDVTQQAFGDDTKKGMNVDFGDFDGNGWLDIYVTNITTAEYLKEGNMLWTNEAMDAEGIPVLMDISTDAGTYDGGWGWGAKFFDFDNDGDLDIISANGFITAGPGSYWFDLASWTVTGQDVAEALNWPPIGNRSFSGHEPTRLWRNEGNRRFTEVAKQAGIADRRDGRGVSVFDYDNDGDLDVYIANQGFEPAFFRNDAGSAGHWFALRLIGNSAARSNRDAIGARVTIVTSSGRQIRELDGGNSFCGQSDRRVFFGLGSDVLVRTVEIRWPSGHVQQMHDQRADQLIVVEQPEELPDIARSLIPTTHNQTVARVVDSGPKVTVSAAERQALLASLEGDVRKRPEDLALASRYRAECVRFEQHDRSIRFFEQLAGEYPDLPNVRLQLSAAYVDKIPTCGGMAAIVSKGTLARQALDQLDMLIDSDPTWWPALYARATNHLYWPRALRHSAQSAADFRQLIALQTRDGRPANERSYYVRAYIRLGDALAKDNQFAAARKAWQEGLRVFPGNRELEDRLALKNAQQALDYVQEVRNLEQPIDTDFSFVLGP